MVAFAIALLIKSYLLQAFYIPSASMEPILERGDRVLVEKVSYRFDDPDRGDVVVFERQLSGFTGTDEAEDESVFGEITNAFKELFGFPTGSSQDLIKRVIATEGDTVEGRDGGVLVNGEPIEEPYVADGIETPPFLQVKVPEDMVFVMGDNRNNSEDSRIFGPVKEDDIVGHAFVQIWPPSSLGGL